VEGINLRLIGDRVARGALVFAEYGRKVVFCQSGNPSDLYRILGERHDFGEAERKLLISHDTVAARAGEINCVPARHCEGGAAWIGINLLFHL